jgi:hypothetical protein
MSMKQTFYRSVAVTGLAGLLGAAPAQLNAQSTIAINNDDIAGVVTGPNGPDSADCGRRTRLARASGRHLSTWSPAVPSGSSRLATFLYSAVGPSL